MSHQNKIPSAATAENHLQSVLGLARRGLAVFPVAGDCRTPLIKRGCYGAEKTPDGIRGLWQGRLDANVAVACGVVSGVFVLDVDVKRLDGVATLKALVAEHGELPKSWLSRTPSGGLHAWFAYVPGLRNRVGLAPGLDCRTDGGGVCAPPSVRRDGAYTWVRAPGACELHAAPAWLLELIAPPEPPRPPMQPIRLHTFDRAARYVAAVLDSESAELARTDPGGRNARLFRASARLGELVGAGVCPEGLAIECLTQAARDCGLVRDDGAHAVAATIRSGLARGVANPRELRW